MSENVKFDYHLSIDAWIGFKKWNDNHVQNDFMFNVRWNILKNIIVCKNLGQVNNSCMLLQKGDFDMRLLSEIIEL